MNTVGWKAIKRRKMRETGCRCEECGNQFPKNRLVLHHIRNRSQGGRDVYENARLRDRECEQRFHAIYPGGNKPN